MSDCCVRVGSPVLIRLQDEGAYAHPGRLDFVDNAINPASGTIQARALVPNPDGFLRPGMMGHLRLAATPPYRAMLVPDAAIATDGTRRLVQVVDSQGNVTGRPVTLGPLVGDLRVIRSGVGPADRVVINGLQRILPGQKVSPRPGRIPPPTGNQPPPGAAPQPAPASVATPAQPQR